MITPLCCFILASSIDLGFSSSQECIWIDSLLIKRVSRFSGKPEASPTPGLATELLCRLFPSVTILLVSSGFTFCFTQTWQKEWQLSTNPCEQLVVISKELRNKEIQTFFWAKVSNQSRDVQMYWREMGALPANNTRQLECINDQLMITGASVSYKE